jgi:multiple sugar transport system permease protein
MTTVTTPASTRVAREHADDSTASPRASGRRGPQGSLTHARDTRIKRTLYVIAGVGSTLVFAVPLIIAILRAFQPNSAIVAAPTWSTFWNFGMQNFQAIFSP